MARAARSPRLRAARARAGCQDGPAALDGTLASQEYSACRPVLSQTRGGCLPKGVQREGQVHQTGIVTEEGRSSGDRRRCVSRRVSPQARLGAIPWVALRQHKARHDKAPLHLGTDLSAGRHTNCRTAELGRDASGSRGSRSRTVRHRWRTPPLDVGRRTVRHRWRASLLGAWPLRGVLAAQVRVRCAATRSWRHGLGARRGRVGWRVLGAAGEFEQVFCPRAFLTLIGASVSSFVTLAR